MIHPIIRSTSVVAAILVATTVIAQHRNDNWQFGTYVGINFSSGAPTLTANCQVAEDHNTAAISKDDGTLLFYTNSDTIWNANHDIMSNGTGIMGVNSLNGATIIPHPSISDLYYVFTTDFYWPGFEEDAVMGYSFVDMSEDGGLGAVVVKNDTLEGLISDKSTATLDEDGSGYWVVFHKIWTNEFYSYHITPFGLTLPAVVSNAGSEYISALGSGEGQFQFSHDGSTLLTHYYRDDLVQLFHFDNSTGIVSDAIEILSPETQGPNPNGVEISPNGDKIYFTTNEMFHRSLYQADISNWDSTLVANSITLIDSTTTPDSFGGWISLELAPDGKIYVGRGGVSWLGVINDPDQTGSLCNFDPEGFDLSPYAGSGGLPNQINSYHDDDLAISDQTSFGSLDIYPNPSNGSIELNLRPDHAGMNLELEYRDMRGALVQAEHLNYVPLVRIDTDLSKGVYLLTLNGNGVAIGRQRLVIHD